MALSTARTDTASFASPFKVMTSFTLTGGADAAQVTLREGGAVSGTVRYIVKAAIGTTVHMTFGDGVRTEDGLAWYVDLDSGTTPQMTIAGRLG